MLTHCEQRGAFRLSPVASLVPDLHALKVDAMIALRYEWGDKGTAYPLQQFLEDRYRVLVCPRQVVGAKRLATR
jgi:hypothetical protein